MPGLSENGRPRHAGEEQGRRYSGLRGGRLRGRGIGLSPLSLVAFVWTSPASRFLIRRKRKEAA